MKFHEALRRFQLALMAEYGIDDGLVKIGVRPDLFNRIVYDLAEMQKYGGGRIGLRDLGELFVNGVQVLQRERDKF